MHTPWCHLVGPLRTKIGPTIAKVITRTCIIVNKEIKLLKAEEEVIVSSA